MKSTDVYRCLREDIDPWARANGFVRAKGAMLAFRRPERAGFLVFWCQCSQWGWDQQTGSQFVVEFQTSPVDRLGALGPDVSRKRLGALLTTEDLERVRQIQNQVIQKLAPPSQVFVAAPYTASSDLWFRYHDEADVMRWGHFIVEVLPAALSHISGS